MMMASSGANIPYHSLVALADCILNESGDNEDSLALRLETLDKEIRSELIVSDLLNAYQVFYYFFRTVPEEILRERLELEPASSLEEGVILDEIELLELIFAVKKSEPYIIISDGREPLVTFCGGRAYRDGLDFIGSTL